ncbi:MAG: MATE family efflux transporter [Spirochaetales bacterium]|nr:MATE family efflux transporter [Spirochaetales bacterium]
MERTAGLDKNDKNRLLGQEKITRLIAKLSIPATVGLLVNSLYNLTDTVFIGQGVGAFAIGGVAIAFPIQILIMSFGMMLGVGAASVVSRSLGAGKEKRAGKAAGNAFGLTFIFGMAVMLTGHVFIGPILAVFGATDVLTPYAYDYLFVILFGSVFSMVVITGYSLLMSEGRSKEAMIAMIIGTGLNTVLDPLFIFVFHMGIQGAAIATVISQFISFLYVAFCFGTGKNVLKVGRKDFQPDFGVIREILVLGFPMFIRQGSKVVFFAIINNSLKFYGGDIAIAVFGVIFRVISFLFVPLMGIGQGLQPIVGFNYGARQYARVKKGVWYAIAIITVFAVIFFCVLMLIPDLVIRIFNGEDALVSAAVPALRIFILFIPVLGFHIVGSIYFFAVGKALPALLLNFSRQIIFLIPLALILPLFFGLNGIWTAFPVADLLSTIVTCIWLFFDMHGLGKNTVN